jgi:hypothetical protein
MSQEQPERRGTCVGIFQKSKIGIIIFQITLNIQLFDSFKKICWAKIFPTKRL